MENNISNEYVTFAFSNIHNTIQENMHEEICDEEAECILPNDLTEVTVVNVNGQQYNDNNHISIEIITDKNNVDENNTLVYPLYIKQEKHHQQQQQQQFTSGDESVAVEALRQLGGTYTPSSFKIDDNIKCINCHREFTKNDYKNHTKLCKKKNLSCTTCSETFDRLTDLNNHIVCHQTDRPHSCRTCGNLFRTKTLLNNHMKTTHKIGKLHKCNVCDEEFMRPSSLSNHMKIHSYTPGRAIKDNNNTTYDLIQTKVTDVDDKNYIEINNIIQNDEEDADDPIMPSTSSTSHNNNLQNYETINTWPNSTYTLINNNQNTISTITNTHDDNDNNYAISEFTVMPNGDVTQTYEYTEKLQQEKKEKLSIPDNTISNNDNIVKKLKNNKEKQQYLCDKCGINFSNISSFKKHEKVHEKVMKNNGDNDDDDDDIPIDCEYCDKQYENNEHLMIHHKTCIKKLLNDNKNNKIINNKYNKHACIECGKKFTTKQKMYRHQWIHRKKTWICEQCGKQYEKQNELDEHRISMHPGDSPYTCNDCGKCFVSRQGLWEHGRTHAGSPAHFHCDKCGKTFSSRQGYLIHHRTHTGERPYGCQYCWKAFRDGGTLRKHERIHTGERPHVCPICKRAFNQKVVLREHVRWVHAASKNDNKNSTPPYPCPLCNYINQDRDELCAHIVKHSDQIIADAKAKVTNVQTTTTTTSIKNSNNNKKSPKGKKCKKLKTDKEQMIKINNNVGNNNSGTLLLVTTDKTVDKTDDNIDDNTCTITIDNNDTYILPCTSQGYQLHDNDLSTLLLQSNSNNNGNQTIHFINENNTIQIIENGNDNNLPIIIDQANNYHDNNITEIIIKNDDDSYEIMESDAIEIFDNYDYDDDDGDLSCKLCGDIFNDKNILMEHIKEHTSVNTK
ncbi:zinc finger protein 665-like [Aphidius gifuensis]|uniref:zinc finger protein 665-like n=1 Tax=Aphidius gifuensis TaxID=684658 RepID=UPI001CDD661A|nr:zinc finger protein 665-like [Aphidius gifuensis]